MLDIQANIALFVVAALASAINSVAGGGTFLTFPLLIFYGLGAVEANVTSAVALWPGILGSVYGYRREWMQQRNALPVLMVLSVCGAAIGAGILLLAPEKTFEWLVPWLLLIATLLFTFGRPIITALKLEQHPKIARFIQFLIAIYGGYFGAGIGILMLAMLQLAGLHHIHRMNALKAVLGCTINAIAVAIFVAAGAVRWDIAWVMVLGAITGGYFGAHWAQKLPPSSVRYFVIAVGVSMTLYFFIH